MTHPARARGGGDRPSASDVGRASAGARGRDSRRRRARRTTCCAISSRTFRSSGCRTASSSWTPFRGRAWESSTSSRCASSIAIISCAAPSPAAACARVASSLHDSEMTDASSSRARSALVLWPSLLPPCPAHSAMATMAGRSPVYAPNGVAATSQPLATTRGDSRAAARRQRHRRRGDRGRGARGRRADDDGHRRRHVRARCGARRRRSSSR